MSDPNKQPVQEPIEQEQQAEQPDVDTGGGNPPPKKPPGE